MARAKAERLANILKIWNTGTVSMREVAIAFDIPRNSVARILFDARKRGLCVIRKQSTKLNAE